MTPELFQRITELERQSRPWPQDVQRWMIDARQVLRELLADDIVIEFGDDESGPTSVRTPRENVFTD